MERPDYSDERETATPPPPPRPIKKIKPRPVAPQPTAQAPSAAPPAPQPAQPGPKLAYTPSSTTGEMAAYAPPAYPTPAPAPAESRGGIRGWMIKMLGGAPAAPPQPQPHPAPAPVPPNYGYVPPGGAPPQPGAHPGYPPGVAPQAPAALHQAPPQGHFQAPPPGWPDQPPVPGFGLQHPGPQGAGAPPHLDAPPSLLDPFGGGSDEYAKTQFLGGVDLDKLKIPKYTFTLQILDNQGQWRDWGPIHANGLNVGRAKTSAEFPGLSSMAVRHMKLRYERTTLVVEDLGSINGVYLRVIQPTELSDGMRFRVGNQTIEFHEPAAFEPVAPLVGEDGEEYCSRDLEPLAYLDLIRPNGQPGLRFPLTKPDATIIGREGPNTHIALTSDNSVSGMHARVYRKDGKFILEDLKSRNGTFVHVLGSAKVTSGDVLLAGLVLFRVVDHGNG
ncbi:FHA domain-containing protein [Singulisphaera acidiphila]|uniref:FHA domain-containing protein n=1 Tax=Singulisphaera acidiphila TaxID=466153 RepID=UPI0012B57ABF|nr:FHA domain-containing protein [Singulisphaera acidiphila]